MAKLFVLYGVVLIPTISILTPPYQVSDEIAHFQRADQVSLGDALGYRLDGKSGGITDNGISNSTAPFSSIILNPEGKVTSKTLVEAEGVSWNEGKSFHQFDNTAIYPSYFYTFSALSISISKKLGVSVIDTLRLARIVNGIVAIYLGYVAISLIGFASPLAFSVLLLPMTLFQMSSVSQDALMLPMAALAAGLFTQQIRSVDPDYYGFTALTLILAFLATGRVSQLPLALLICIVPNIGAVLRMMSFLLVCTSGLAWTWISSRYALVQFGMPGANSSAQTRLLLEHPSRLFMLAVNTIKYQYDLYLESFVGKLGWLDLRLPVIYIVLALSVISLATTLSFYWTAFKLDIARSFTIIVSLLSSIIILFMALYISWTPVGNFIVDGIQGRYFIPLSFFVPCIFLSREAGKDNAYSKWCNRALEVFPLVTTPVVILGIVYRYYLV